MIIEVDKRYTIEQRGYVFDVYDNLVNGLGDPVKDLIIKQEPLNKCMEKVILLRLSEQDMKSIINPIQYIKDK